jgi:seryl-tRNA synthetase
MLDIKLIRENTQVVLDDYKKRGRDTKEIDEVLGYDKKWRDALQKASSMKAKRNIVTREIASLKKDKKDASAKIKEMQELSQNIAKEDEKAAKNLEKRDRLLLKIPNILHESVPVGKDDEENVEVKTWGKKPEHKFKLKSHVDLIKDNDWADLERAAKTSGSRFYFLKGDLARLNYAIQKYALDFICQRNFTLMETPMMIRREVIEGVTDLADFEEVIYKIEDEDLYMIATSEHPIGGYHMNEIIEGKDLPLRYAGISSCFRKEAGSHGKDTKGIFRVHQFTKIEQFVFCKPEESWKIHEEILKNAEEFFQSIGIHYHVVNICTGDIGIVAAKKYDIEIWMPVQGKYREVVSASNCTDYQARRLKTRYVEKTGSETQPVHTLNSTLVATSRLLVAILENNQKEDGSVEIPKALQPYMGGQKIMKAKKD